MRRSRSSGAIFTGEKVTYAGRHYALPLPGAKPMRVSLPPVSVPVYLATLSPKMLALTGEIADGWLGTSFIPEQADAYLSHLDEGLARAGRTRADLDICQGAEISLVTEAELASTIASRKTELAFSLGGMGTATANFYNDAYSRQGWAEVAAAVRDRWQAGDRTGAAALVTDEMVLATTLIGTEDMVRARLRAWREAGVDTVRLYPSGDTLTARLDTLARGIDLVRAALPDPHLVEQRSVHRRFLVVPDPGGDESGEARVEERDVGCLVGDDAVGLGPQPPSRGGVGELRRLRLAGQRVDVRIAEPRPSCRCQARQPTGSSARGPKKVDGAGKSAPHPPPILTWILVRGLLRSVKNWSRETACRLARYPRSSRSPTR